MPRFNKQMGALRRRHPQNLAAVEQWLKDGTVALMLQRYGLSGDRLMVLRGLAKFRQGGTASTCFGGSAGPQVRWGRGNLGRVAARLHRRHKVRNRWAQRKEDRGFAADYVSLNGLIEDWQKNATPAGRYDTRSIKREMKKLSQCDMRTLRVLTR